MGRQNTKIGNRRGANPGKNFAIEAAKASIAPNTRTNGFVSTLSLSAQPFRQTRGQPGLAVFTAASTFGLGFLGYFRPRSQHRWTFRVRYARRDGFQPIPDPLMPCCSSLCYYFAVDLGPPW